MIDYKYKDLFLKSHIDKQLRIATDDGLFTATNPDINWENFELSESLCSDSELHFGNCEPSMVKFQIRNAFIPLAGKWLTVTETLDGNTDVPFQYGRYKVFSDVPTADKEYRDITAYDAMYDILNADMAAWYNSVLPNKNNTVTLRQFRTSFIRHFGLTEAAPARGLVNDNMTVEKTIEPEEISGKDIITAICEINGCFGHIGRDGKFHYIYLPQAIEGLYPANDLYPDHAPEWMVQAKTGHLYPQDPQSTRLGTGRYIKCQYEDYITKRIARLQIRQKENDIGIIWPDENGIDSDNCYIIEDNFLVYGKSHDELSGIARNIFSKITDIVYRPFDAVCVGNPCLEVGDPVRFPTKYAIVESYILKRTLKGIQALRDSYKADGTEKYSEKLNGLQKSIVQLKGKTNVLERTVDETRLEMKDMGEGLSNTISITTKGLEENIKNTKEGLETQISATAGQIRTEISNEVNGLNSTINQTAKDIRTEVSETYETKKDASVQYGSIRSSITQTANSIKSEVAETYETKTGAQTQYKSLSSSISQTAGEIRTEVSSNYETKTSATSNYNSLSSRITQNATKIESKVSNSEFGTKITQNASSVQIAWNNISNYIQFESGELRIYDSSNAASKQLVSKFNYSGNHFYRDGYYIGNIGTGKWAQDSLHKSLDFHLEPQGKFMAFAQKESDSETEYKAMLTFSRADSIYREYGVHLGCGLYTNGYPIYLYENSYISASSRGISVYADKFIEYWVKGGSFGYYYHIFALYDDEINVRRNLDMNNYSILNQSDIRLKKNILPPDTDAFGVINSIELKQFDWRESGEHVELGAIAQQVYKVCPDLVNISKDGLYSLQLDKFIPYLVGAVQMLSKKVDVLECGNMGLEPYGLLEQDLYNNAENLYTESEIEKALNLTKPPEMDRTEPETVYI